MAIGIFRLGLSLAQRSVRHPALRAAVSYAGITAFVKAAAFVKEAVVAAQFGVSGAMDAYLMALVVIGFPSGLLLNAAHTVFVREYVRIRDSAGAFAADGFFYSAASGIFGVLLLLLLSWLVLLPVTLTVVGRGLGPEQRATVTTAVYWLGPYFLLNGLNLVGYGALQAKKSFVASAAIPLVTPVATIVFVATLSPSLGVLAGAITAGAAIETLVIASLSLRAPIGAAWRAAARAPWLRELVRGTAHLLPGTAITGLTPVIEQAIASTLGRGAISSLGYASKLPATINALLVTAVGVTILPYFSELVASGKLAQCRTFFVRYAVILFGIGAAVLVVTSWASEPFVRIAFQRGAFSPRDTVIVAALQRAYLWQLPGALVSILAVRFVAAYGRFRALAANQLVIIPLIGLLQWRLAASWGAAGVAFGTAIGATLSAVAATWLALRISR